MCVMDTNARREQMRRLLARREREGLTHLQTAALEPGVTAGMVTWWARKFREEGESFESPGRENRFVQLSGPESSPPRRHELVLSNGRRLWIDEGFDSGALERLLVVIERSC